jgi:DNA-binding transcriptional regulator YhcF (GntR family)
LKLWLSKKTGVPLQEQLRAQLVLAIVSADVPSGGRLPSSSHLARRFHVHPNTVRLAYRQLVEEGWIEWRQGRGFFVRDRGREERESAASDLDLLIAEFLNTAQQRGFSRRTIRARLKGWFVRQAPSRILVIERDAVLRKILVCEIQGALGVPVQGADPGSLLKRRTPAGVLCTALYDHVRQAGIAFPAAVPWIFLRANSIAGALMKERRPPDDLLVSVVSTWTGFLERGQATLTAVGLNVSAIELVQGGAAEARLRLSSGYLVITDGVVGRSLTAHPRLRVFQIVSQESLEELRKALKWNP